MLSRSVSAGGGGDAAGPISTRASFCTAGGGRRRPNFYPSKVLRGGGGVASAQREAGTRSGQLAPARGTEAKKLCRARRFFMEELYPAIDFEGLRLRNNQ